MSRSTLLGGGGEQTSRLKNSQEFAEADMANVFQQGFSQLSSKDRSAVRPIMSYLFLAWCWWWRASLERGNVIFLLFSTRICFWKISKSVVLRQCASGKVSFPTHSSVLPSISDAMSIFSTDLNVLGSSLVFFPPMQLLPIQHLPSDYSTLCLTPVRPLFWECRLSCHYTHRTLLTGSWYLISAFAPHTSILSRYQMLLHWQAVDVFQHPLPSTLPSCLCRCATRYVLSWDTYPASLSSWWSEPNRTLYNASQMPSNQINPTTRDKQRITRLPSIHPPRPHILTLSSCPIAFFTKKHKKKARCFPSTAPFT